VSEMVQKRRLQGSWSLRLLGASLVGAVCGVVVWNVEGEGAYTSCENKYRGHAALAQAMAMLDAQQARRDCLERLGSGVTTLDQEMAREIGRRDCDRHLDGAKDRWQFRYYRGLARNVAAGDECALHALTKGDVAKQVARAIRSARWSEW
jgi:hypothetical protein